VGFIPNIVGDQGKEALSPNICVQYFPCRPFRSTGGSNIVDMNRHPHLSKACKTQPKNPQKKCSNNDFTPGSVRDTATPNSYTSWTRTTKLIVNSIPCNSFLCKRLTSQHAATQKRAWDLERLRPPSSFSFFVTRPRHHHTTPPKLLILQSL
jgi:hypothetical protein